MTVQALRLRRGALSSAVMLALAFQLPQAYAQSGNEPATDEAKEVSSVVVTGSRIKRTQSEGPAPVTIISSEQIQREGFVTVSDVLETVTQASGSTQNELNSAGGFTPNASVINLRGLGPGRTLLLVNGRRAADYPFPTTGRATSRTSTTSRPVRWTASRFSPAAPPPFTARTRSRAWSTWC